MRGPGVRGIRVPNRVPCHQRGQSEEKIWSEVSSDVQRQRADVQLYPACSSEHARGVFNVLDSSCAWWTTASVSECGRWSGLDCWTSSARSRLLHRGPSEKKPWEWC